MELLHCVWEAAGASVRGVVLPRHGLSCRSQIGQSGSSLRHDILRGSRLSIPPATVGLPTCVERVSTGCGSRGFGLGSVTGGGGGGGFVTGGGDVGPVGGGMVGGAVPPFPPWTARGMTAKLG